MHGSSRRGFFSLKKLVSPACCSLLICLFKYTLMDLIQASSLAALCYLLIFAFIWQSVYKPQYSTGPVWALWDFLLEGLSIKTFILQTNK